MDRHKPPASIAGLGPARITMPGMRPATLGEKLQCPADMPTLPRRKQKTFNIGFWDPMRNQLEMFWIRR